MQSIETKAYINRLNSVINPPQTYFFLNAKISYIKEKTLKEKNFLRKKYSISKEEWMYVQSYLETEAEENNQQKMFNTKAKFPINYTFHCKKYNK